MVSPATGVLSIQRSTASLPAGVRLQTKMNINAPMIVGMIQIKLALTNPAVLTTTIVIVGSSWAPTPVYSFMNWGMTYVESTITRMIEAPTSTVGYARDFLILRRASVIVF